MVNGKCGCLSAYVFAFLYLLLLAIAARVGERRGKWVPWCKQRDEGGSANMSWCRASGYAQRGGQTRVHCGSDGGGVNIRAVVEHRAKRARERKVRNGRVMPIPRYMIN
jgi:hypothetical protein